MPKLKKQPLVNIIILNWNGWKDTCECLESLKKINYKNYRIFVLDNGSENDSYNKLKDCTSKNKKITLLSSKKNLGFAKGNNFVLDKINKKQGFVLLLNNDVLVKKDFLDKLINFQDKNNNSILGPLIFRDKDFTKIQDTGGFINFFLGGPRGRDINKNYEELNLEKPLKRDYLSGCCMLIPLGLLKEEKLFNEDYFCYNEEIEFCIRIKKKKGTKFYVIPESKIYHKGGASTKNLSAFKLFYDTRNKIWTEREYASFLQFFTYILFFFFLKFPKTLISLLKNKKSKDIPRYVQSIKQGFFSSFNKLSI